MKQTLLRKIASELSKYFQKPNKERTLEEQSKLFSKIKEIDQMLKLIKEDEPKADNTGKMDK